MYGAHEIGLRSYRPLREVKKIRRDEYQRPRPGLEEMLAHRPELGIRS